MPMMKKFYSLFLLSLITLTGIAQDVKVNIVKFSDVATSEWQILDFNKKYIFGSENYHRKDTISLALEEQKQYYFYVSINNIKKPENTLYEISFGGETYTVNVAMGEGDHYIPFTTENIASDSKIVGGTNANINDFPWQVYIESTKDGYIYSCGGTIIAPNWILTAAHCVQDQDDVDFLPSEMFVYYGSTRRTGGPSMSVQNIIRHANYNNYTLANDIALLELINPISGGVARPISMITAEEAAMGYTDPGVMTTVTGWGLTIPGDNNSDPEILQKVNLPIVPMTVARSIWTHGIPAGVIMAGYHNEGKDACSGDSGGPMVVNVDGEYRLAGIVSFGHVDYDCDTYGGYTEVSKFENWIRSNTGITKWTPEIVNGVSQLCVGSTSTSVYTINGMPGVSDFEWNIHPLSAASIESTNLADSTVAFITWTEGFTGDTYVKVRCTLNGTKGDWAYFPVRISPITTITQHSIDSTILCANGNFILNVTAQGDNLSYTWYQNGKRVGTNKSFNKTNANESHTGIFTCQVSGACGSATTGNMYVEVKPSTKIEYITSDTTATFGDNISLTAKVQGTELKYQWFKNNEAINGATSPKLNFTKLNANDIGNYHLLAQGTCGVVVSKPLYLYVNNEKTDDSPSFNMWPTITSGIVNIAVNGNDTYNYKIFNSIGKLLMEQTGVQYQCSVDLTNYPRGIYIIQVYNDNFRKTQKVIKDR